MKRRRERDGGRKEEMGRKKERQTDRKTDRRKKERKTDGRTDGRTEGRKEGRKEERKEGRKERKKERKKGVKDLEGAGRKKEDGFFVFSTKFYRTFRSAQLRLELIFLSLYLAFVC